MAKNKVSEWSSTPANNTDVGGIDIAEGCAPSGINNAIREVMAQVKDMQAGLDGDNFTVGGNLSVTGTVSLSTDLPVASGGTGASTASDARTNLGLGTIATQAANNVAITGGSVTGITDLAVADGGTGASTAANARTNLGVTATGADTTYAFRANNLSDLASASTARTNLGLGSIATQAASSVSITGGSITGITDLAVADGGTGASSITANSVILGNGTSALSGNLVAPSTAGNVLKSDGTTWTSAAADGIGTMASRNFGTTYTAATDGFFVANSSNGGAVYGGFTMTVAGNTVVYARSPSEGASGWQTGMFPIKKGQSYRADLTGGGASSLGAWFIPFGN